MKVNNCLGTRTLFPTIKYLIGIALFGVFFGLTFKPGVITIWQWVAIGGSAVFLGLTFYYLLMPRKMVSYDDEYLYAWRNFKVYAITWPSILSVEVAKLNNEGGKYPHGTIRIRLANGASIDIKHLKDPQKVVSKIYKVERIKI